jgi:hypothetical protein
MKHALITDGSVQWFTYLVSVAETGECIFYESIPSQMSNDFLSNIFSRPLSFSNLRLIVGSHGLDTWYGNWISEYDFKRIKKMTEIYPQVLEYQRLGAIEKV